MHTNSSYRSGRHGSDPRGEQGSVLVLEGSSGHGEGSRYSSWRGEGSGSYSWHGEDSRASCWHGEGSRGSSGHGEGSRCFFTGTERVLEDPLSTEKVLDGSSWHVEGSRCYSWPGEGSRYSSWHGEDSRGSTWHGEGSRRFFFWHGESFRRIFLTFSCPESTKKYYEPSHNWEKKNIYETSYAWNKKKSIYKLDNIWKLKPRPDERSDVPRSMEVEYTTFTDRIMYFSPSTIGDSGLVERWRSWMKIRRKRINIRGIDKRSWRKCFRKYSWVSQRFLLKWCDYMLTIWCRGVRRGKVWLYRKDV